MTNRYFALVDCNNFYASCERTFAPELARTPIVVLSNNDGCVIARSNEAKAIGIPMGTPLFKVKRLVKEAGVKIFSSNYELYGDMSRRVMEVLAQNCHDVEVYSIDEAFLELRFAGQSPESLFSWALDLRRKVTRGTGIPVSVGIGKTKTLAKLANHIAKKRTLEGIYFLDQADNLLREIDISEVWGCGRAYVSRLNTIGVETVRQLQQTNASWIQKEFGVVGSRLLKELNGFACHELEPPVSERKHTMVSRSFAHDLYELDEIKRRLALYATRLGAKLRQYQQAANVITVYLWVNRFKNQRPDGRSCFARTVQLPQATNSTNQLIKWANTIVGSLYEENTNYKKAGIMASELVPETTFQGNLFANLKAHERDKTVMSAVDKINKRLGKNMVYFAACGDRPSIPLRQEHRSPCYTTRVEDLLLI